MTHATSDKGNFLAHFYSSHQVPPEAIEHFRSQPWLHQYLDDPSYRAPSLQFRVLKDTGEDFFFARTIATPTTIPHILCLNRRTIVTPPELPAGTLIPVNESRKPAEVPGGQPDCIFLINLAGPAIDGHPHVCHGGIVASILDEAIGMVTMLHTEKENGLRELFYTVNLNVTYRAPVTTPSNVIVRCWLKARQGRKYIALGQIVDKDGVVLSEAQGTWVLAKKRENL
ncbi:hypothetical protein DV735_g1230, partial [Chaetothyriales sp. CBS 134920]